MKKIILTLSLLSCLSTQSSDMQSPEAKNLALRSSIIALDLDAVQYWLDQDADFFNACADLLFINEFQETVLSLSNIALPNHNCELLLYWYQHVYAKEPNLADLLENIKDNPRNAAVFKLGVKTIALKNLLKKYGIQIIIY